MAVVNAYFSEVILSFCRLWIVGRDAEREMELLFTVYGRVYGTRYKDKELKKRRLSIYE